VSRGRKFQGEEPYNISQRKYLSIYIYIYRVCVRCPNRVFFACTSLQLFRLVVVFWLCLRGVGGGDVMWYGMMSCGYIDAKGDEVM